MPALPLDDAGPYVAGAFLVFLGLILVYVAIMASKLGRIERELGELHALLDEREVTAETREEVGAGFAVPRASAAPIPRARRSGSE